MFPKCQEIYLFLSQKIREADRKLTVVLFTGGIFLAPYDLGNQSASDSNIT